jgi:hypothetical protein
MRAHNAAMAQSPAGRACHPETGGSRLRLFMGQSANFRSTNDRSRPALGGKAGISSFSGAAAISGLPGQPGTHGARRRPGLAVTIVQRVLVDETENVSPFLVRSHHELTVRRESAPQLLILIAGRIRAFQMPCKGAALLLRYNQRGKATAAAFDLGNPIPLSAPCPDERWLRQRQVQPAT